MYFSIVQWINLRGKKLLEKKIHNFWENLSGILRTSGQFSPAICHSSFFSCPEELFESENKPKNSKHVNFCGADFEENKRIMRFCQNLHPRVQKNILRERGILRKKFSIYTVESRSGKFATMDNFCSAGLHFYLVPVQRNQMGISSLIE